jgi:hypothetical protein
MGSFQLEHPCSHVDFQSSADRDSVLVAGDCVFDSAGGVDLEFHSPWPAAQGRALPEM